MDELKLATILHDAKQSGGATQWFDGKTYNSGYVVGNGNAGLKLTSLKDVPLTYLLQVVKRWERDGYRGFGLWYDTKTGLWYVDPVLRFLEQENALFMARHWDELAIWDIANNTEIRL